MKEEMNVKKGVEIEQLNKNVLMAIYYELAST